MEVKLLHHNVNSMTGRLSKMSDYCLLNDKMCVEQTFRLFGKISQTGKSGQTTLHLNRQVPRNGADDPRASRHISMANSLRAFHALDGLYCSKRMLSLSF
jgi:hypothetical protein